jgi:hypothetical protein
VAVGTPLITHGSNVICSRSGRRRLVELLPAQSGHGETFDCGKGGEHHDDATQRGRNLSTVASDRARPVSSSEKVGTMAARAIVAAWAVLHLTAASYAQSDSRDKLPGYRGIMFGMTEAQARAAAKLGGPIPEPHGVRLKLLEPVIVDGVSYEMSMLLVSARVGSILLSNDSKRSSVPACESTFQRVLGLVQSKYGMPDQPVEAKRGILTTRSASFTFRDGNGLAVSMFYIDDCLTTIAYVKGKGGESF